MHGDMITTSNPAKLVDSTRLTTRPSKMLLVQKSLLRNSSTTKLTADELEDEEIERWIEERNRVIAKEQGRQVPESATSLSTTYKKEEDIWIESSDDDNPTHGKVKRSSLFSRRRRIIPFHPDAIFRRIWELINLSFILYSSGRFALNRACFNANFNITFLVIVPYRLAFSIDAEGGWYVFEWAIDVFFWLDIVINFLTAYKSYGRIVGNLRKIARHYAKSWFCVDLIASFPYDLLVDALGESSSRIGQSLQLLRLLRTLR